MTSQSKLKKLEKKLKLALKDLEKREQRSLVILSKLERVYGKLLPLYNLLENVRIVDPHFYKIAQVDLKEISVEVICLANELEELRSTLESERESLRLLLALVELLRERSRGRKWLL
ncbi:MAG: hypothetical protein NZ954_04775 [Thermofilaceae archaeon]|nr:hypothetical protein [Thermofilaceae archaeon]MCX8180120.1 hypothetical protein [Thermofilaceae archaeon]MDW8004224.1 hypothetical protein [Thermofilaceae archaeon]